MNLAKAYQKEMFTNESNGGFPLNGTFDNRQILRANAYNEDFNKYTIPLEKNLSI
jgi:hypothetical protein